LNSDKLEKLGPTAAGKTILILTHNNPDPDAIAASWALHFLLKTKFKARPRVAYGGIITRAENRAMVRLLKIKMQPLDKVNLHRFEIFALVDTQPGTGNNSLPSRRHASIIIDHHSPRRASSGAAFTDIRPHYGSSSTILIEYLIEAGLPIRKGLATALYYGLKTDTQDLGRNGTEADYKAAIALYPDVQLKRLSQI